MKKIVLFAGLLLAGSSYAQHQKGEWFVTAGGRTPFTLKPLRFSPYVQTGFFLAPRFATGLQYQYAGISGLYQTHSYGAFARYYLVNRENVGLYGFASFLYSKTNTTSPYILKESYNLDFGLGSSVALAPNWRLNMEVNLLGRYSFGGAARVGVSYTIPYRKKAPKTGGI